MVGASGVGVIVGVPSPPLLLGVAEAHKDALGLGEVEVVWEAQEEAEGQGEDVRLSTGAAVALWVGEEGGVLAGLALGLGMAEGLPLPPPPPPHAHCCAWALLWSYCPWRCCCPPCCCWGMA